MTTYTLKVIDIREETSDSKTICFKQPSLKKIKYNSGQYLTLIFRINGRRYIRPYSFSSSPLTDSALEVTVKRVPNGIVSNHIHDVVRVGDSIEVLPAMGDFTYNSNTTLCNEVFLWGVGSGITPLISLIKQILNESPEVKVNLIYGNRDNESTIFSKLINEYEERYHNRFKVWRFHTRISVVKNASLVQGRITKESVLKIMKDVNPTGSLHYICGPFGLKESVKQALSSLEVFSNQIFSEDFEVIKDPKDFEQIVTQNVKLKFDDKYYDLEVIKGKSILESALDAGIELPYSCQTGNCNTCIAKIGLGSLKMIGVNKTREDLLANEYLLCCSYPLTDDVYIEV